MIFSGIKALIGQGGAISASLVKDLLVSGTITQRTATRTIASAGEVLRLVFKIECGVKENKRGVNMIRPKTAKPSISGFINQRDGLSLSSL